MAIVRIGSVVTDSVEGSSITTSYTQVAGTNRVLLVYIPTETVGVPTSVTFDGISLSKRTDVESGGQAISLWYLANPPVKTSNVVANFGSSDEIAIIISSWAGVKQDYPFAASNTANGSGDHPTDWIPCDLGDHIIDCYLSNSSTDATPDTGQIELADFLPYSWRTGVSDRAATAGNNDTGWATGSANWLYITAALQPNFGWSNKINTVTSIGKINTIGVNNISKVNTI
jgi:hypothetical protein